MSYQELHSKKVRTRKMHRCEWCGEMIAEGDVADYRAYKYEGDFNTDYMHEECTSGMRHSMLNKDLRDFGFEPGAQFRGGLLGSREAAAWNERYGRKEHSNG